ncbi:LOW QUALITY PROTEIN: cytotoxin/hemolysin tlyA, partial [Mycobacterium tuberculosis EAS054]
PAVACAVGARGRAAGTGAGLAQRRRQGQPAAGPIGQCRVLPVVAHADRPGIVGQGIGGCGAPCD